MNVDRRKDWQKEYNKRTRKSRKNKYLIKHYGITLDEYDSMRKKQKGRCAICLGKKQLHVDHCHATGYVRGLLCMSCNTAIGKLDTPAVLHRAAKYITRGEKHG